MTTLNPYNVRQHYRHEEIGKRAIEATCFGSSKRIKSGISLDEEREMIETVTASCTSKDKNDSQRINIVERGSFGSRIISNHNDAPVSLSGNLIEELDQTQKCKKGFQRLEPSTYAIRFSFKHGSNTQYEDDPKKRRMLDAEIAIIGTLQHENITSLHTISSLPSNEPYVVMDKIVLTMEEKIKQWQQERQNSDMRERLRVFHALSSALDLLHEKKIIHRGLEPCKVGFDTNGIVKLFDFSLSKQLSDNSGSFLLTAMVGSPLYIAPENHRGEPYGFSVDVFSLCVLAWEILTLEHICYDDKNEYVQNILGEGQRPDVPTEWPLVLRNILRYGWAKKPSTRPTIKVIHTALDQHLYSRSFDSPNMDYIRVMLLSNGTFLEL